MVRQYAAARDGTVARARARDARRARVADGCGRRRRALAAAVQPGIGKTRLLDEAAKAGSDRGFRICSAQARELERDLAWGVVRQAFARLIGDRAEAEALLWRCGAGPAGARAFRGRRACRRAELSPARALLDDREPRRSSAAAAARRRHPVVRRRRTMVLCVASRLDVLLPEGRGTLSRARECRSARRGCHHAAVLAPQPFQQEDSPYGGLQLGLGRHDRRGSPDGRRRGRGASPGASTRCPSSSPAGGRRIDACASRLRGARAARWGAFRSRSTSYPDPRATAISR